MITTSYLWLDMSLGMLAAGSVLGALLALNTWDRHRQAKADAEHQPRHRAVEEPLPSFSADITDPRAAGTPAYDVLARLDAEVAEVLAQVEEHTDDQPVVAAGPVEHVEAAEEPTVEGAIGTLAADESPEMADAAWRHEHDKAWTQLLVGWAERPPWLAEFGADSLQLPEYRRLVLEHTQDVTDAAQLARLVAEVKAEAQR